MGSKILQVAGANANKAIDDTESLIRKLIDTVLLEKIGNKYWSTVIPSDIKSKVQDKISEFLRKNPQKTWIDVSSLESLEYCDIMDYSNIILKNWEYFEKNFHSKSETEKRFISFKDYRNVVKHGREMNTILQRDGEAALEWFSQALNKFKMKNLRKIMPLKTTTNQKIIRKQTRKPSKGLKTILLKVLCCHSQNGYRKFLLTLEFI